MDDSLVAHVVVVAKDDLHEVEVLQSHQEVAVVPDIEIFSFKEHKNVLVVVLVAHLLGGYHLVLEVDLPDIDVVYVRLVEGVGPDLSEVHHKRKNVSFRLQVLPNPLGFEPDFEGIRVEHSSIIRNMP